MGRKSLTHGQGAVPGAGGALAQHGHAREELVEPCEEGIPVGLDRLQMPQFLGHLMVARPESREQGLGLLEVAPAGGRAGLKDAVRGTPHGRDHHESTYRQFLMDDGGRATKGFGAAHGGAAKLEDLQAHS
jgi:hypothetical protein